MLVFTFCIEFRVFVFSYLQYTESGGYEVKEFKLVWWGNNRQWKMSRRYGSAVLTTKYGSGCNLQRTIECDCWYLLPSMGVVATCKEP